MVTYLWPVQDESIDEGLNPIGFLGCPLILEMKFSGDGLEAIGSYRRYRFGYFGGSCNSNGTKDVIHIAIGVLANIATGLALDASSTRELFQFAGQIFKQLLGTVPYPAGPH